MAFDQSVVHQTVFGNDRVQVLSITADAVSGVVATGLQFIHGTFLQPVSMASASGGFKRNTGAASAVANGSIQISGVASGDTFLLQVLGR